MKNKLTSLLTASTLFILGLNGCTSTREVYNGDIGDDQVTLRELRLFSPLKKELTVRKPDERKLTFIRVESKNPFIRYVEIIKGGKTNVYTLDDKEFMVEAANTFNDYIARISSSNAVSAKLKRNQNQSSYLARQNEGIGDLK